jgi:hypothetical protein
MLADQPTSTSSSTPRNRLLAALPADDLARLWPRLEAVELPSRQVLHAPGKPITSVYFPETGYVSMLAYRQDRHHTGWDPWEHIGMDDHRARRGLLKRRGVAPVVQEAYLVRACRLQRSNARQQQIGLGCRAACRLGDGRDRVWSASGKEARVADRHLGMSSLA